MDFLGGLAGAAASIFNGIQNRDAASALNTQNINNQQMFANYGLEWRAADARRAEAASGINALTLLGAPTSSFSNVTGDTGLGDSVSKAGHDLGRAIAAQSPDVKRQQELENKLLEAKIANTNADTISTLKTGSDMAVKMGQPATAKSVFQVGKNYTYNPDAKATGYPGVMSTPMVTSSGDLIDVPTQDFAQRTQTMGAIPASILGVVEGARQAGDRFLTFMNSGARGDVWRSAQPNENPFGFQ